MYSRTRTFGAEVHKSNIRVTRWHSKYKILNCIERHNFCLSDLSSIPIALHYRLIKQRNELLGHPVMSILAKTLLQVMKLSLPFCKIFYLLRHKYKAIQIGLEDINFLSSSSFISWFVPRGVMREANEFRSQISGSDIQFL